MTSTVTETVATDGTDPAAVAQAPYDDEVLAELLVEEISIDGMCGVY
jgi:mycofactocin precursor